MMKKTAQMLAISLSFVYNREKHEGEGNFFMLRTYFDPNDFEENSDSKCIQAAINEAVKCGCRRVVIPSYNRRSASYLWEIDESILLPSHITVELQDAHLRMADGVFCQMFRNSNALEEIGMTPEGLQEDIVIQGVGRSILDGGVHNGLREKTSLKDGLPHIFNNLTIYLHNVKNFKISGLTVRDQRWWGITFAWAWQGVVKDIRFEITDKSYRESKTHPWRNQDGIDLRVGCHDIQISDLSGETCDDIVALTALAIRKPSFECFYPCDHLSGDIYNVTIRNIVGFNNHCAMVRLLCHNAHQIYNIDIADLIDATPDTQEMIRTASCVKLGENDYCNENTSLRCKHGEMHDISISNVFSSAKAAVVMNCSVKNAEIRGLHVAKKGFQAISVAKLKAGYYQDVEDPLNVTTLENIFVSDVQYASEREGEPVFYFNAVKPKNFRVDRLSYPAAHPLEMHTRKQEDADSVIYENVIAY